jgi:hypothetical protein
MWKRSSISHAEFRMLPSEARLPQASMCRRPGTARTCRGATGGPRAGRRVPEVRTGSRPHRRSATAWRSSRSTDGSVQALAGNREGGFGVVYMAEQTRPVRRKVQLCAGCRGWRHTCRLPAAIAVGEIDLVPFAAALPAGGWTNRREFGSIRIGGGGRHLRSSDVISTAMPSWSECSGVFCFLVTQVGVS